MENNTEELDTVFGNLYLFFIFISIYKPGSC